MDPALECQNTSEDHNIFVEIGKTLVAFEDVRKNRKMCIDDNFVGARILGGTLSSIAPWLDAFGRWSRKS